MTLLSMDDELYNLLNSQSNSDEQQLFVKSFSAYLKYGDDDNAFVINFDDVWEWVGFSTKGNAKKMLVKHFEKNIDFMEEDISLIQLVKQPVHGGQNKETIMLSVNTFKKFCMKASTKRADQICDYYVKMENIMIKHIKNKMEQSNVELLALQCDLYDSEKKLKFERHHVLVQSNHKKKLVYIMIVEIFEDGSFIIKIGETDDIKERSEKLSAEFKTKVIVVDVFLCTNSYQFEQYIHKHNTFMPKYKYKKSVNNKYSTEIYHVKNNKEYSQIKDFLKQNLNAYDTDKEMIKLRIQERLLNDDDLMNKYIRLMELSSKQTNSIQLVDEQPNSSPHVEIEKQQSNVISREYGPKVQIYNSTDLSKVVQLFNGITEATRQIKGASFTQIKYAVKNKLVYMGYRWNFVKRNDMSPNEPKDIGDSVVARQRIVGLIALVDLERTTVLKVFNKQSEIAEYLTKSLVMVRQSFQYGVPIAGHNVVHWNDLDKMLQDDYISKGNELPNKPENIRGTKIHMIDPNTNKVVKFFNSITDVCKEMKLSPKTIKNASLNDLIHNGFKWKVC